MTNWILHCLQDKFSLSADGKNFTCIQAKSMEHIIRTNGKADFVPPIHIIINKFPQGKKKKKVVFYVKLPFSFTFSINQIFSTFDSLRFQCKISNHLIQSTFPRKQKSIFPRKQKSILQMHSTIFHFILSFLQFSSKHFSKIKACPH